jgi:hypothetical protein
MELINQQIKTEKCHIQRLNELHKKVGYAAAKLLLFEMKLP